MRRIFPHGCPSPTTQILRVSKPQCYLHSIWCLTLRVVNAAVSTDKTDDLLAKPILFSEQDVRILEWLTLVDHGPRHRDLLSKWQPETGLWLLNSAEYKTWLNTKGQTLFCPGDIGTGKTILTSVVTNDVKMRFQSDPTVGTAYIYCDRRDHATQWIDELIASILKQLTQKLPSLPTCVLQMYEQHRYGQTRPYLSEILRALHTMLGEYSRVFIIVDALDECPTSSGCRQSFLTELSALQSQCGVNCFATSRLDSDITAHFSDKSTSLEIQAKSDVEMYVKRYMEKLPDFTEQDQRQQEIILAKVMQHVDNRYDPVEKKLLTNIDECSFLSAVIFKDLLEEELLRGSSIMEVVEDKLKSNTASVAEDEAEDGASLQSLSKLEHDSEQQDMATESNTFRNEETWTTDLTSREQFSDSGYASMPHGFTRTSKYSQKKTIMEESCNITAESESNNNLLEENASIDQADDRTEYSAATSLRDSRIEGLVSQLADQLIGKVFLNDERSKKTVSSTLQDLLKNFALKFGFDAQSQIQRDIMYYTHKYSR